MYMDSKHFTLTQESTENNSDRINTIWPSVILNPVPEKFSMLQISAFMLNLADFRYLKDKESGSLA